MGLTHGGAHVCLHRMHLHDALAPRLQTLLQQATGFVMQHAVGQPAFDQWRLHRQVKRRPFAGVHRAVPQVHHATSEPQLIVARCLELTSPQIRPVEGTMHLQRQGYRRGVVFFLVQ